MTSKPDNKKTVIEITYIKNDVKEKDGAFSIDEAVRKARRLDDQKIARGIKITVYKHDSNWKLISEDEHEWRISSQMKKVEPFIDHEVDELKDVELLTMVMGTKFKYMASKLMYEFKSIRAMKKADREKIYKITGNHNVTLQVLAALEFSKRLNS